MVVSVLQRNRLPLLVWSLSWYKKNNNNKDLGLGETVVLDISKKLRNSYYEIYFDNFFNSPTLVDKLFDKGVYCIGTVRTDRKNMAVLKKDKAMKRVDIDFQYADKIVAV